MPKATHTRNTGCVVALSRRQFGGATLAALCGATFASAVVLPDQGEAFSAAASPDADLVALCAEFFRLNAASSAIPDDASFTAAMDARDTLVDRISATTALSAAGLQAKAGVGHFLMDERRVPGGSLDDVDTYGLALMRELLAGSVDPAPMPANADAELIRLCAECDALQARMDALYVPRADHLPHAQQRAWEKARDLLERPLADAQDPLLHRICELRATTPQGQAARARTLLAWDKDPCWTDDGCWNSQLIGAIVRDAVREG